MINPVKKVGLYIADKIDKLLLTLSGTIGGLFLVQFPQFLAQYIQRLGGHIDEAQAASSNYNLPELVKRVENLKEGLTAITGSTELYKLPKFLIDIEWSIAKETSKNYTPGMTFDELGFYYFGAGLILGLLIYGFLKFIVKKGSKSPSKKKTNNTQFIREDF